MHVETILQSLNDQRCYACGGRAVSGASICAPCAQTLTVTELAAKRLGTDSQESRVPLGFQFPSPAESIGHIALP